MGFVSRGFKSGRRDAGPSSRIPPGQHLVTDFPVLSAGPTRRVSLDTWTFSITGEIDEPKRWSWKELRSLPAQIFTADIHCVTKWSKLDTSWTGVSVGEVRPGDQVELRGPGRYWVDLSGTRCLEVASPEA